MTSIPTSPAGSSSRNPPSLRSTGVRPFAAYQRWFGSQAASSSSLPGSSVVRWISAMDLVPSHLEPEEVPRTQCQEHLPVVADLGETLAPEEVDELRPRILQGQLDRRRLRPRREVEDEERRLVEVPHE